MLPILTILLLFLKLASTSTTFWLLAAGAAAGAGGSGSDGRGGIIAFHWRLPLIFRLILGYNEATGLISEHSF